MKTVRCDDKKGGLNLERHKTRFRRFTVCRDSITGGDAFELRCRLTSDQEEGEADRDQVFTGSHNEVIEVKLDDQASANFIAGERANYCASSP